MNENSMKPNKIKGNAERYRSGHNGAVLKTVRGQPHAGSNPVLSAICFDYVLTVKWTVSFFISCFLLLKVFCKCYAGHAEERTEEERGMTNEQLLLQIGRMIGDTVRDAVQESEARLSRQMNHVAEQLQETDERLSRQIKETDERLSRQIEKVAEQLKETDERLTGAIENLEESVRQSLDDTEKMALMIAATVERIEKVEGAL